MRKRVILAVAAWLVLGAAVYGWAARLAAPAATGPGEGIHLPVILRPADTATPTLEPTAALAQLPVILKPENTPTPVIPTPPPTRVPAPSPTPGFGRNWLANGSFEEGWTDLPPVEGFLINQEPKQWTLSWLQRGETVWDLRTIHPDDPRVGVVSGVAEMIHKLSGQLPIDEQLGGPHALILEGGAVYKMFHHGAAFGSQLSQTVSLPAGHWRLTVPVQLHWHEALDPADPTWDTFTAESGAWVLFGGQQLGSWATAREMGDRRWYYHVVEFDLAAETEVEVLIRVKSIYESPKDFFIDAVWLEPID